MTSNVTVAPTSKRSDFSFPTPFQSGNKWNYSYDDAKYTERHITAFAPVIGITVFFLLFSRFGPFGNFPNLFPNSTVGGIAYLAIFIGALALSIFAGNKLTKRTVAARNRKRDEFRRVNASFIIEEMSKKGWRVAREDATEILIRDDHPYLLNEDGVRYYARYFQVGINNVTVAVELCDEEVEEGLKRKEKQSRTDSIIAAYEASHGTMSPEKRSGFVTALEISL